MTSQWSERLFEPRATAVEKTCVECGRAMWLSPSRLSAYSRCGRTCMAAYRARERENRKRTCETCGSIFYPRPQQLVAGGGRFCSQACNSAAHEILARRETRERAKERIKEMAADGSLLRPRGILNKLWLGGRAACIERAKLDGRTALRLRTYRRLNPHKVKEFSARRDGRKTQKLPNGTILRIGKAQKWKCAICRVKLKKSYHHDHITPLARGGEHVPRNIQLLCGPCNQKKHAKDPILYMQSLGRLL